MSIIQTAMYISLPIIILSVFIALIRLIKGPSIEDRIVSLDALTSMSIGFIACYAVLTNSTMVLDVGLILALLSFLATVSFAYYIERRHFQ